MPAGLQVWDASGNLIFDVNSRIIKFLGDATISSAWGRQGYMVDNNLINYPGTVPFVYHHFGAAVHGQEDITKLQVWIDYNRVHWQYPHPTIWPTTTIIWGIF